MRLLLKNHSGRSKLISENSLEFAYQGFYGPIKRRKDDFFHPEPLTGGGSAAIYNSLARRLIKAWPAFILD
jgi:hypothetical protein